MTRQSRPGSENRLEPCHIAGVPGQHLGQETDCRQRSRRVGLQHAVPPAPRRVQRGQRCEEQCVALRAVEPELADQPRQPEIDGAVGGVDPGVNDAASIVHPRQQQVD